MRHQQFHRFFEYCTVIVDDKGYYNVEFCGRVVSGSGYCERGARVLCDFLLKCYHVPIFVLLECNINAADFVVPLVLDVREFVGVSQVVVMSTRCRAWVLLAVHLTYDVFDHLIVPVDSEICCLPARDFVLAVGYLSLAQHTDLVLSDDLLLLEAYHDQFGKFVVG